MALRIGKLARLTGRSVHTIRWYEAQRLIPGVRRDPQGRRVYHEQRIAGLTQALEIVDGKLRACRSRLLPQQPARRSRLH